MADLTFAFGSSYGSMSSLRHGKRARTAYEESGGKAPSKIEDRRVAVSALRLDCDLITIKVGKDASQRSFKIHEHVICDHTEYFHNHMKDAWTVMKDEQRVIELPNDNPDAFALWRTWIYTEKIAILPEQPFSAEGMEERSAHYAVLAHAYVLGEMILDIPFMNAIADVYVLNARGGDGVRAHYPTNEDIAVLYDGTSPDSPIRKLLVDIWMYRGKVEWLDKELDDGALPREFLIEVTRELLKLKKAREGETMSRPWKMTHEQYHDTRMIVHGQAREETVVEDQSGQLRGENSCKHRTGLHMHDSPTCMACLLMTD
ncbi:hypothetical protein BU23DRAFT_132966 [Bimuria novae-zelandiae CBS 107.79]|uniref:BTB domain-containing protein n=1 Tax=Bimuria novae-zelandiae CBS 107.79 TaxID=1447943 RepID=A0A6A5V8N9_9PLEO|nr:hypothetical protein BU23DRAFT_132966 [Bimuria novae-zelandiae CBS 107.79]